MGAEAPAAPDPLAKVKLYHFTDVRNLPLIVGLGGLYPFATLKELGIEIPAPGGNEWSLDADEMKGMDKYVHLCFLDQHPMEYIARVEGRILDPVFLEIDREVLIWKDVLFTAGVANKAGVAMYAMEQAASLIDCEVLYTRTDWKDVTIYARRQVAEKSEIIVPGKIPLNLIKNMPTPAAIDARVKRVEERLKATKEKESGG